MYEKEPMYRKHKTLKRVLHPAWPGGETRTRNSFHAGIGVFHFRQKIGIIETRIFDHHVERISGGELSIAKGIARKCGEARCEQAHFADSADGLTEEIVHRRHCCR